jgi:hypothetical protein
MKKLNAISKITVVIIVLGLALTAFPPSLALAQANWGASQLIEDNAGYDGYYPQVAISGSNAVAVWYQSDGSNSRIYSSYSTDGGATWSDEQLIEDNAGNNGIGPQVAISGSNAVAVWHQHDGSSSRIYSNYSTDGGATWHDDLLIEDNDGNNGHDPQVAISGSNVVAVWYQWYDGDWRIYSNYSSDGGDNWGTDQLIEDNDNDGFAQQVAICGSNAVAVWYQWYDGDWRIYSNYSSDGGANWGSDQLIEDNAGNSGQAPQVAICGSNAVAVWKQSDGSNSRIYSNYSSDGGANWGSDQLIEDNAGNDGYFPQVAICGSNAVAVWEQDDGSNTRIYSNYSSDRGANWGSDRLIENNAGNDGYFPQVAISGYNAVAVWHQSDGSNFRIYSNYSSDGGDTWGTDQIIEDNVGYDGYHPEVAICGSNTVAVWQQEDDSNLRIYSNHATDGPIVWDSDQLIEDNAGYDGTDPQVDISGSNVVAVWEQWDDSDLRIYSNYSTDGGATWSDDQLIEDNVGYDGTDPQVAISGSNAVAVWHQWYEGHARIYSNYSTDGGATWSDDQIIQDAEKDGNHPDVDICGSNAVAVWTQHEEGIYRIYSSYSTDRGATWSDDQLIEDNDGEYGYHPQVVISGSNVVVVWYQVHNSKYRIYSNYSSDRGANWGTDQLLEDNDGNDGYLPKVAISGSNAVAVWYQWCDPNWRIYSNYSSDGGANWGGDQLIEDSTGYGGSDPHVDISGSNAVTVWEQRYDGHDRIYSNYSTDGGATWSSGQLIEDNTGCGGWNPKVAMCGSNAVAVWEQWDGSGYRIYSNYSTDRGVTWNGDQLIEDNAGGLDGRYSQVAISGSNAVAVWEQHDGSNTRIYSNYGCPSSPEPAPPPTPEPSPPSGAPVGIDVFQVNKVGLVAPWIILAVITISAGAILLRRRVRS